MQPASRKKKVILYTISALFFIIGLIGFMQISWLFSKPLTDAKRAELSQKTTVPEDARAYNTNHGKFIFFKQRPRDNPQQAALILAMLLGGLGVSTSINIYLVLEKRKARKAQDS